MVHQTATTEVLSAIDTAAHRFRLMTMNAG
jgi:hypothetical protein